MDAPESAEADQTTSPADRFEHPITVRAEDIDANGHANNVVYVRWIQEAAVAHWFAVVDAERARTMTWAVVRHEVDYRRPALLDEELVAATWVGAITAATCERFCEIRRPSDGVVLARSRTVWCVFDPASGRPKRIDPTVRGYFRPDKSRPEAPAPPSADRVAGRLGAGDGLADGLDPALDPGALDP